MPEAAYQKINTLLEERFGIHFPDYRRIVLENRLQARLQALDLNCFEEYCEHLTRDEAELERFVSAVTNNETHFFRAREQLDTLFGAGLDVLRDGLVLDDRVRILSAACSSGEEPYSIAFCASEARLALQGLEVHVDAFDIDRERLQFAESGACSRRSAQMLSPQQAARYLDKEADRVMIRAEFRKRVRFSWGNLIDARTFAPSMPYDAVFCRNALIYFSPTAQRRAIDNLASVLRPGGLLFLGHAESGVGALPNLETVRIGNCLAYRRVRT